jgi:hypothetical protein
MRYSCQQQHCDKHDEVQTACAGARLQYRRIDGGSSLDEREKAIQDFNAPKSQVFIFLLSIRAAGRGLNLQTADTVVMYDPDPNPKNEEQAVARSHRIGQTKPVRVVHLETVADAPPDARALDDPDYNDDGPWSRSCQRLVLVVTLALVSFVHACSDQKSNTLFVISFNLNALQYAPFDGSAFNCALLTLQTSTAPCEMVLVSLDWPDVSVLASCFCGLQ